MGFFRTALAWALQILLSPTRWDSNNSTALGTMKKGKKISKSGYVRISLCFLVIHGIDANVLAYSQDGDDEGAKISLQGMYIQSGVSTKGIL